MGGDVQQGFSQIRKSKRLKLVKASDSSEITEVHENIFYQYLSEILYLNQNFDTKCGDCLACSYP